MNNGFGSFRVSFLLMKIFNQLLYKVITVIGEKRWALKTDLSSNSTPPTFYLYGYGERM
jgi:hypothetical protein